MKYDFQLTRNPQAGNIKTVKGSKRVFNLNGDLLCFLRKGRIYDLNAKVIAPCVNVKGFSKKKITETRGCCEDGKNVYFDGEKAGIIGKSNGFRAVVSLFIVLLAVIVALSAAIYVAEKNKIQEIRIVDHDGVWEANAKLDIFGKELLQPGAKGEYLFAVYNPNAFGLQCDIQIDFTYGSKTKNLPVILYALTVNGKRAEIHQTENGYYVNDVVLNENARNSFILAWEWKFDGESDENDTEIGRKGEEYECEILITARKLW